MTDKTWAQELLPDGPDWVTELIEAECNRRDAKIADLEHRLARVQFWLEGIEGEIEARRADLANRIRVGGQQVPFHGDFCAVPPSGIIKISWWCRALRAAMEGKE
jgi:hypothetical protein